jgi:S-adenosylmethionine synthetase
MMRNIYVDRLKQTPVEDQGLEIVERKGLGHPDTICDSIMNEVSVRLSEEYMEKFGAILHHNIDKALLVAGNVETKFGGGTVRKPMRLIFGDRATFTVGDVEVPVDQIAIETAKDWFKRKMRFVDPEKNVTYQVEIQPGSSALVDIFKRKGKVLGANDTSAAVGWAPLTKTEKMVFATENYLNSKEFKDKHPESGEDIKVMGLRKGDDLDLITSMAFVGRFIGSEEEYFDKKAKILEEINAFVKGKGEFDSVHVQLNTLDVPGRGVDGVYLTVLGTSAEEGDSGQIGRGNRVNGAGKNPVSHVGKIYNLLTFKVAKEICDQISGLREVYVWMLSRIGQRIDQPAIAAVQVIPEPNVSLQEGNRKSRRLPA